MSTLTIGKLAKSCDVNIDTVRYYERMGLLMPLDRTASGYRVYDPSSIKNLKFVRRAQSLGLTLEEIKELLELHHTQEADCADVKQRVQDKILQIQQRMDDLQTMKRGLEKLASACKGKGTRLKECSILEYFYGEPS